MPSKVLPFGPEDKNTTIWSPGSHPIPSSCANVYSSLFVEGYFYKVCPTGFSSNQLYLSFPAGFVNSTISQEDATQAARELLAEKGQEIAEAQGTCSLGEFQEIFSTIDATYNWDWVADKDVAFPRPFKNTLPDSLDYGTGDDSLIIIGTLVGNTLSWPLMVGFFYSDTTLFLAETGNTFAPTESLNIDIQNPYGLIHMDFRHLHHDTHPNLVVYAGNAANGAFDFIKPSNYVAHVTSLYAGKLVADFGSREIYGPAWDEDTDGPSDKPAFTGIVNENEIPEFTVATLGGFLFRIDTTFRSIINGKLAGVYLVCYKEDIQVYKYNAGLDDYESLYSIPYNPKNKTTYFGCSILYDGENKVAEIYIDGQFELSIPDNTLANIHLPVCYQRGVFSVDHWVGDIVSGVTYPGTNRLPPPITTRYFEPTALLTYDVEDPDDPLKKIIWPVEPIGSTDLLAANKPFPKLAAGEPETGFKLDRTDFAATVSSNWGGNFFGGTSNILTNFDLSTYPEIGAIPWGSYALMVGKTEMNRYSSALDIPNNPYKFLMVSQQLYPIIPNADVPGIDFTTYPLFELYQDGYNQHPRWSCSWDAIFQPSDLISENREVGNATKIKDPSDRELPAFQAGVYDGVPIQTGDGWLYTTSMLTLTPGRVFSNSNNNEFVNILTKDDIINHHYYFGHGWYGNQLITDLFTAFKTIKFMTGTQGKRTSDVLEAPVYDYKYRCPIPPTFPEIINVNIGCLRQEYEIVGVFGPISGGTHFPLIIEDYRDCLFGNPYDDVCYPTRQTWKHGFDFIPQLSVLFSSGDGLYVKLIPFVKEMVHGGARLLAKLHTEFFRLDVTVRKEGWPNVIYRGEVWIDLRDEFNDPPATDIGFSTAVEACYLIPETAEVEYREILLESPLIPLIEVGARYKFVFSLPGSGII